MSATTTRPSSRATTSAAVAKLPRPLTLPPDLADQRAVGTHDEDPLGLAVEHVQPSGTIERHPAHIAELLPLGTGQGADPEHFLEVRVEPAVLGGEFDHLLRIQRGYGEPTHHNRTTDVDHDLTEPPHASHLSV